MYAAAGASVVCMYVSSARGSFAAKVDNIACLYCSIFIHLYCLAY